MKLMKVVKMVSKAGSVGEAVVKFGTKTVNAVDHFIHREEYERAKRRARVWKVVLCVAAGVLVVLLFPYKLVVEKNGDFEIRTLLLRVFRKTEPYAVPEGGSAEFEIAGVEEDFAECEVIEAVEDED